MKRWIIAGALALAVTPGFAGGQDSGSKSSKAVDDPFYRRYLVPGNPLDEEILAMEARVEASPDDANLRNDFGNLLALRGFPEQAADQYQLAAKLDHSNFISLYNLGLLRETENKTSDAISAYKKSISRKPGFPQSRFRLGRLYEQTGRLQDAVTQYAKALWIDPSMRDPRRNPLVIDSDLMYRASIENYERDMARVTLNRDVSFHDEPSFRRVPVDRSVAAAEVAEEPAPAPPREVGPGTGSMPSSPPAGTVRRPQTNPQVAPGTQPRAGSRSGRSQRTTAPPAAGGPAAAPPPPPEESVPPEAVPPPSEEPTPAPEDEVEPS